MKDVKIACSMYPADSITVEPRSGAGAVLRMRTSNTNSSVKVTPETARILVDAVVAATGIAPKVCPKVAGPSVNVGAGVGCIPRRYAANTRAASEALLEAFPWGESPEGFDFWCAVQARLSEIADELERPVAPAINPADYATVTPPGYNTVCGYLFARGGAEKALSADATKAGVALRKANKGSGQPEVRVTAPAAVTAACSHIKRVLAYPTEVLEAYFQTPDPTPVFPMDGSACQLAKAQFGLKPGAVGTVVSRTTIASYGAVGFNVKFGRCNGWVYPSTIAAA